MEKIKVNADIVIPNVSGKVISFRFLRAPFSINVSGFQIEWRVEYAVPDKFNENREIVISSRQGTKLAKIDRDQKHLNIAEFEVEPIHVVTNEYRTNCKFTFKVNCGSVEPNFDVEIGIDFFEYAPQ
ncbi:MAG: hypothetical protein RL204_663 [Bacteroidota bacterium]|jgi:hypothetical protein